MRASAPLSRIAAACALLLVTALLAPGGSASAAPTAGELTYACALKSNGLLRAVSSLSECTKNETKVTLKPGPRTVCVQPSGSTRLVNAARDCRPPATVLTLPPLSGTVYFCAALSSGTLRYVTASGECLATEVQVEVTPNDAAPAVTATSPTDGATQVATDVGPTVTFGEPVNAAAAGAFALACDGAPIAISVSGSGGATLSLDPTGTLPESADCTITVHASGISDVDTLDPPDHPVADSTFSFTTDAPPSLVSSSPVAAATGVATSASIVLTFSEPVDVATGAFTLSCGGPTLPYAVSGSGTSTVTIDPDADLPQTATCTLAAAASSITDSDGGDPPDALTAPLDLTFTTVDDAPAVAATTPGDGATNVATTTDVSVTFSEPVTLAAGAFALVCDGNAVATTTGTADQTTFIFSPTSDLSPGAACTGTVEKTKVTDNDTVDPPGNPLADHTFSFTVDTAPAVATTDPADNTANVPADQVLTVTFTEAVTVTQDSFVLTCNGTPVTFTLGGSSTVVTLTPTGDLPGTAACTLTVVAAEVHDVDAGDPPDTMTTDVTVDFTTVDTAPSVLSTSPANGATDVAAGATITVTFSEPVTADAGAFTLECPSGTTETFSPSGAGTAVWTLDPDAALPADTVCTLTVTASKIHDVDGIDPPDELAADVTVEFTVAANSAPTNLALAPSTVAENQPSGTAVGTFSSTDPDPGDTFTYSLAAGLGDTDNGSFTIVGDQLRTAAAFDFETKASYSVNVRTTDSAGNFFEKALTVTVTDVNEAPTDITLANASVAENEPSGTVIGALGASDPDVGQTHTFTVVSSGCGGTYADGSSFTVTAGALVTAAPFDFETKSSYSVCVRVADSGSPALSFDELFAVNVTNVNEAPVVGGDSYSGAIGNTLAVRGVVVTGPQTALSGALPLANDSDPEGDTITVVPGTIATSGGGSASINADGTFSYLPGVGVAAQTDTFTYTVTDGVLSATGTISIAVGADRVWWVDASAAPGGDGRSTAPFTTLAPVNGAGGAGDVDSAGDHLFVYAAPSPYAGGLALEANQRLHGQRFGLAIAGVTLVPAGATAPTITNAGGNGVNLANGVDVQGVTVAGASADGIHGDNITTATIGSTVTVSGSTADGIDLTGAATGSIAVAATVTGSTGRSVNVSNRTGGTIAFTGPITGTGISLSSNTGATITFSAALTISSGAASAFSATGGGTVTASDLTSTLTSTTGSTLVVENTSIGATGLKFRSVSANGAANGIRLNATGSAGGLQVVGGGNTSVGGNASGGTIQNTTDPAVSLTSTAAVSLNNLTINNTPAASGVKGTGVAGFSFTHGTISGNGSAGGGAAGAVASNIAFDTLGDGVSNVSGAVTVSNSVLASGYNHGLTIYNNAGTISSLTVTGNTVTSAATAAGSIGNGVLVQAVGSAGTGATITTGSISSNTITGFPGGSGIRLTGGNPTSLAAPISQIGTSGTPLVINANQVHGFSAAVPMSTEAIIVLAQGRGTSFIDVTNNGSNASPVGRTQGDGISVNATWQHNLTSAISNNVVAPGTTGVVSNRGITGGAAAGGIPGGTGDSAVLTATVSNNTVSQTKRAGIYFVANQSSTLRATVQANNVAAPTELGSGIRLDSGTSTANGVNTTVCATISGNTTAGFAGTAGIALRKEGTAATVNRFGIPGLSPSPTTTGVQTTSYVAGLNAGSVGGVLLVAAATGFTSC